MLTTPALRALCRPALACPEDSGTPSEAWLRPRRRQAITLPENSGLDMRLLAQDYDVAFLQAGDQADDQNLMVRPAACLACARWGDQAHRGASRRAMRFDCTCRPLHLAQPLCMVCCTVWCAGWTVAGMNIWHVELLAALAYFLSTGQSAQGNRPDTAA